VTGGSLLGWGFEQEFADIAGSKTCGEIIERAVSLAAGTTAIGLSTGGKTLNERGA